MTTATTKTFTWHNDPGHGWLQVSIVDLLDLDLAAESFSCCSYYRAGRYYLEEDCDATLFLKAYEAKHGSQPNYIERHTNNDSPIRNYGCIYDGADALASE